MSTGHGPASSWPRWPTDLRCTARTPNHLHETPARALVAIPHGKANQMSDTPTTDDDTPTPDSPPADPPARDEIDWKAEARKWEERAKANKDAADKLAAIEEASKTEAQKLADRAAAAEAKVAEYEAREQIAAWKAEVAQATKVPAEALRGATKEEIEAHAETLSSLIKPNDGPAIGPYVPPEGIVPAGDLASTADKFAAAVESALP